MFLKNLFFLFLASAVMVFAGCGLEDTDETTSSAPPPPNYDTGFPNGIKTGTGQTFYLWIQVNAPAGTTWVNVNDPSSNIPQEFVQAMNTQAGYQEFVIGNGQTPNCDIYLNFTADENQEHGGINVVVDGVPSSIWWSHGTGTYNMVQWFYFTLPQTYVTLDKLVDDAGTQTATWLNNGWH